ncbi:hypothetical protein BH10BDE1_BH10BDE1_01640 [soil metagenome]
MILDDIRDKGLEALHAFKSRLDESDSYIQLKERYESFSPLVQKMIAGAVALVVALLFLQIPLAYYGTGSENIALFEENRDLVLDLYKVKRKSLSTPQLPSPLEKSDLEGQARQAVTAARVQPEQIKAISFIDNAGATAGGLIPKTVTQAGVEIRLGNLNLTQIVDIGHALTNLNGSTKIIGLEVRPGSAAGNYFDANFKVVSFNIDSPAVGKPGAKGEKAKRK